MNYDMAFHDYRKDNPDDKVKFALYSDSEPSSYIPVVKGNEKLVEAINQALKEAQKSGELSAISEKYFGVDVTQK